MPYSDRISPVAHIDGDRHAHSRDGDVALFHDMQQPIAALKLVFGALEGRWEWAPEHRRLIDVAAHQVTALQAMLDERLGRSCEQATTELQQDPSRPGRHLDESADGVTRPTASKGASLDHAVRSVIEPLCVALRGRVVYHCTSRPLVPVAPLVLRRAVANVVTNAVEATQPDGTVEIALGTAGPNAVLTVDDSGAGFGRKPVGSGLGLAGATAAVLRVGGQLSYLRSPLGGVRVRLELPAVSP